MSRSLELMTAGPTLIMSLPANDPELARAAARGGADVLKIHIRVHHDASGTHFGTLAEERDRIAAIIDAFDGPVGIVAGATDPATPEEMAGLRELGIDFFDLYLSYMPAWMWQLEGMAKAVALEPAYTMHQALALEALGADLIEAAIIPHDGYGQPLTMADLAAYRDLRDTIDLPIIVPTQRAIRPEEATLITRECGIEALMIGAIVTGKTPQSIEEAVRAFKKALEF
ncbi:MAG: hypothetical protein ACYDCO_10255 [Armatimonadota bacterium]